MLKVQEFLLSHPEDGLQLLSGAPYHLVVREGLLGTWSESLVLIKYNQIASKFEHELVRECRGIILDRAEDWKPVCHPFHKFFNLGETHAATIDWSTAQVLEKIDDSLIKVYFYKNEWRVATNGTIDASVVEVPYDLADGIKTFGDLFRTGILNHYDTWEHFLDKISWAKDGRTLMFEVVGPHNKVVISYPRPDVYFLGQRESDGEESAELISRIPSPTTYSFTSENETAEFAKTLDVHHEGFVVVDSQFNRVKIKGDLYLKLHYLKGEQGQYTADKIYDVIQVGEDEEVLVYFPEFTLAFDRVRGFMGELFKRLDTSQSELQGILPVLSTRKEQALWITENYSDVSDFLFGVLDSKYIAVEDYMDRGRRVNHKRLSKEFKSIPSSQE